MQKRLYITALISSPILAVYGGLPLYIFDVLELKTIVVLTAVIMLSVLLGWWIHIWFIKKFPKASLFFQFTATYLINLVIRMVLLMLNTFLNLPEPPLVDKWMVYPIIMSLVLNAIIMLLINSIRNAHNRSEAEKQVHALQLENTVAQKQLLMQQLQPHFLFNALSTLKSLMGDNVSAAEAYTVKLSDFLRYSIQSSHEEMTTIKRELQFVQDYIDLQKIRFGQAFDYTIAIPEESMDAQIPVLSLQTLVENIFKHNYFTEKNKLHFSITLVHDGIEVKNKKVSVRLTDRSNTGLKNLNKRCQLIMQKPILITDDEEFFTAILPYQK